MIVALVGFPNCGKSTLFNRLTGANQHVGNFPGVTVEQKRGHMRSFPDIEIVDLPGLYSLCPYTAEEAVARDFLLDTPPDAVIHILDATNPERHLYLTLQLLDLEIPVIAALNLIDEAQETGRTYDLPLLEKRLGIPFVPICASRGEGIGRLEELLPQLHCPQPRACIVGADNAIFQALQEVLAPHAAEAGIPLPFAVSCAVMGEETVLSRLSLRREEQERLQDLLAHWNRDPVAALAEKRYDAVERLCKGVTVPPIRDSILSRSLNADRLLTHRLLSVPLFFGIMFLIFFLTFRVFGAFFQGLLELTFESLSELLRQALTASDVAEPLVLLLTDGMFAGISSILTFLPTILILFFFLSLMEDSGYLARVAFVLDRPLRRLGLSGRALVPILIGFGCSVPAALSARTLSSRREQILVILLLPFVTCSAKIPLLSLLCAAFFSQEAPYVMFALYLFGLVAGLLSTGLLSRFVLQGKPCGFLLELPPYRFPSPLTVALHMWEKAKEFLKKAFTVILLSGMVIWFLRSFNSSLQLVPQEDSLLAMCARSVAAFLTPLGIGDWRLAASLLSGLSAKEAVVSTLAVLFSARESSLTDTLCRSGALPGGPAALSFLVFFLLYLPCFASLATFSRELGKRRYAFAAFAYQLLVAWLLAFLVYRIALILTIW